MLYTRTFQVPLVQEYTVYLKSYKRSYDNLYVRSIPYLLDIGRYGKPQITLILLHTGLVQLTTAVFHRLLTPSPTAQG